jgi:hypothetical protein
MKGKSNTLKSIDPLNKLLRLLLLLYLLGTHALPAEEEWVACDYLLWKIKKAPLPVPLVTSASLDDPLPGALGQPGTKVLLGDHKKDLGWQNGFRFELGGWTEGCRHLGIEASFFILPKKSHRQSVATSGESGALNLAVPIDDVTGLWGRGGVPGETVFILPGPIDGPGFRGRFSLKTSSMLLGAEVNTLYNLISSCNFKIDVLGGFRWLQLQESLHFTGKTVALPNGSESGFYNFKDSFKTYNNFFGAQMGLKGLWSQDCWLFKGFAKAALGCMNENVKIEGKSQTSNGNLFYMTRNTGNQILRGGIFAEPTNRGSHHRDQFAVVLETGASLSYLLTDSFEIGINYNFLWVNQLSRPGKQMDRKINPTQTALAEASRETVGIGPGTPIPFGEATAAGPVVEPKRPKFKHQASNFWAQGLAINVIFNF